jgi:GGDEF domain-containing protein
LAALPRLDVRLPRSPETRFRLTASIGLAVLNGLDRRLPNLCAYAEEAKRFAKESGRDRICVQPEGSILEPALH